MAPQRRSRRVAKASSSDLVPYRGPIRLPTHSGLDSRTIQHNLVTTFVVTADSSAVIRDYVRTSDVTAALDWANFSAVWSEARVKAMRVDYVPFYNGTYAGVVQGAGSAANTHVPITGPPANQGDACQHVTWKPVRSSERWSMEWRARGIEENAFESTTGSMTNHGAILWYIDNLTNGTEYGRVYVTYLVEYRGRR